MPRRKAKAKAKTKDNRQAQLACHKDDCKALQEAAEVLVARAEQVDDEAVAQRLITYALDFKFRKAALMTTVKGIRDDLK